MKIKIIEGQDPEHIDLGVVARCYSDIAFYKSIAKNLRKDNTIEREIIGAKLKTLRKESKNYATMCFKLQAQNRRSTYWEVFTERPKSADIKGFKKAFIDRVKEYRKGLKAVAPEKKDLLGFSYETVGGVLTNKNTIVDLQTNTDPVARVRATKKPIAVSKNNYVGVEIELICIATKETLETALIQYGLAGFVRVGTDGSINIPENKHGVRNYAWELTVMCKQEDLKSTFTKLNKVLNLNYIKAYVNNSCGLHVHIDCRNRDHKRVYANLVNALPVLSAMVPHERLTSPHAVKYSKRNTTSIFDQATNDRYQMVNPDSFGKYKTIEIRLHSGSTNATKIVNWASLLVAVAEGKIDSAVKDIDELAGLLALPTKLVDYVKLRTQLFAEKKIKDTIEDHDSTILFEMAV